MRVRVKQLYTQCMSLFLYQSATHPMKSHAPGVPFKNIHQAGNVQSRSLRAIEREKRILASTPEQSIFHTHQVRTMEKSTERNALGSDGTAKSSGCTKCARSSRLSTIRGPGRLK